MARGSTASQGRTARSELSDSLRAQAYAIDEKARQLDAKKALKDKKLDTKPATNFFKNPQNGVTKEIAMAVEAGTKLYAEKYIVPTSKQMLGLTGLDARAINGAVAIGDPVVTRKPNGYLSVSQSFEFPYTKRDDGSYNSAFYVFSMDLKSVTRGQKVKLDDLVSKSIGGAVTTDEGYANSMKYRGGILDKDDV